MPSDFQQKVAEVVRRIPEGTVLGYGEVAMLAGRPGGARAVVRALQSEALRDVPWWRVVRSDRTLAEEVAPEQARRLRAEGVTLSGRRLVPAVTVTEAPPRVPAGPRQRGASRARALRQR